MWIVIISLWFIPAALGIFLLLRMKYQIPVFAEPGERLLLGNGTEPKLSLWLGVKYALLSMLLFFVGMAEGLVLINIGLPWLLLAPLATALVITALLIWWLRSAARENSASDKDTGHLHHQRNEASGVLS